MAKIYAGIGSRKTPDHILHIMRALGKKLADDGWFLRSGGAAGADTAFEEGAKSSINPDSGVIYSGQRDYKHLPWGAYHPIDTEAFDEAAEVYTFYGVIGMAKIQQSQDWWWNLVGRNVFQILGMQPLTHPSPVKFVVFWSPEIGGQVTGGTRYATQLADKLKIPTYNLWRAEPLAMINRWLAPYPAS